MEEKIKNIMEEIKDLRRKIKIIEGKTEDLPEKIFEIKKASKKANDPKERKICKDGMEDINLQLRCLLKDIHDLEDSEIFQGKIKIIK